jgi:hypothetical protein
VKREGRVRRHNGVRQRWCHDHEAWLDEAEFRLLRKRSGDVYETVCRSCQAARARRYYVENADRIRRRNQERYDAVRDATRAARGAFPTERAPAVPVSLVGGWIQETSEDRRSELAGVVGVSHATLNRYAAGSGASSVGLASGAIAPADSARSVTRAITPKRKDMESRSKFAWTSSASAGIWITRAGKAARCPL